MGYCRNEGDYGSEEEYGREVVAPLLLGLLALLAALLLGGTAFGGLGRGGLDRFGLRLARLCRDTLRRARCLKQLKFAIRA